MRQYQLFQQDFGAPPPPPTGVGAPPPPPTGSGSANAGASTNAIIALVCGIASFIFCPFILGIIAWVMGKGELGKIDRGESSEAGRSMANIGKWLGIINVCLSILFGLIYILIIVIALVTGGTR